MKDLANDVDNYNEATTCMLSTIKNIMHFSWSGYAPYGIKINTFLENLSLYQIYPGLWEVVVHIHGTWIDE